jgi:hypothetical protein
MWYSSLMGRGLFPTSSSFTKIFPIQRSVFCGKERLRNNEKEQNYSLGNRLKTCTYNIVKGSELFIEAYSRNNPVCV